MPWAAALSDMRQKKRNLCIWLQCTQITVHLYDLSCHSKRGHSELAQEEYSSPIRSIVVAFVGVLLHAWISSY